MLGLLLLPISVAYWWHILAKVSALKSQTHLSAAEKTALLARQRQTTAVVWLMMSGFAYGIAEVSHAPAWVGKVLLGWAAVWCVVIFLSSVAAGRAEWGRR